MRDIVEPEPEWRLNALRHLAVSGDLVAVGAQWRGRASGVAPAPALLRPGAGLVRVEAEPGDWPLMRRYIGSVAFDAATSPHGSFALVVDARTGAVAGRLRGSDICGVAPRDQGFATTTGLGAWMRRDADGEPEAAMSHDLAFANHLTPLG